MLHDLCPHTPRTSGGRAAVNSSQLCCCVFPKFLNINKTIKGQEVLMMATNMNFIPYKYIV